MNFVIRGRHLQFAFLVAGVLTAFPDVKAQQPTPSPTPHTGRSYSTDELPKTPPPPGPNAPSTVTFTDITAATKIGFKHAGSPTSLKYLLETMGGGAAIFDYDNDGRMDLFFTNGALLKDPMPKGAMPGKSEPKFWNRLYHQKADGTFTDVTSKLGVAGGGWSASAGWIDYDHDGRLDLFVARYLDWDFEKGAALCGDSRGTRAYCHPENFKGATNILYHQKGDGTFEDVSVKAGIADPDGKALGVAFADFDNDGFIDIFVANDSVRQSLYRNRGDGTFEDIAVTAGAGYDEDGKTYAGMGVDAADYDNDGFPDVFITTLSYQTYPLYDNNGDMSFTYATKQTAVGQ